MKVIVFVCLFFCLGTFLGLPQQSPNDKISEEDVKRVIEAISEDQYVRIPKKDYDAIIENQISILVNKKINALIGITVAAIGLFSALSLFQNIKSKNSLKEELISRVDGLKNEMSSDLREFIEKITESNIEPRFKNYERFIELEVKSAKSENQTLLVQIQEELKRVVEERKRVKEYILDSELKLIQNAVNTKTASAEDLKIAERLLWELEQYQPESPKIPTLVDLLSYIYYGNKSYAELNKLIDKYSDRNLSSNTYINAALTALYDYHHYAVEEKKIKALDYLDKSLQITQAYGEALGLKLELFMMDYTRSDHESVKQEAVTNAESVLKNILNSASDIPSYETISRLSRDIKVESYQNLIDSLYELFQEKMEEMLARANRYDQQRARPGFTLAAITTQYKSS